MKIIGCLLVVGILLSYAPVFYMDECAMDECPEGNHSGHVKMMDCGVPFHCPMIVDIVLSEISRLPLHGLVVSRRMLLPKDGIVNPIFHPPKYPSQNVIPRDEGEWSLGTRIAF